MNAAVEQIPTKTTSLADLRPAAPPPLESLPQTRAGFDNVQAFALAQRAGNALAASSLIPEIYRNNLPNCLIALEMAQRIGASPLMVMQHLYIVQGRPAWSAVFMIASFNQCGRFSAIRYEWLGERGTDSYGCRAWAVEKATGEKLVGSPVTWAVVKQEGWDKKSGSKWKTMPEQMFMYRAAAWFVRAYAPEISMGLAAAEEMHDVFQAGQNPDGSYGVTLESLRGAQETVDTSTGEITGQQSTQGEDPKVSWLEAIASAGTVKALDAIYKDATAGGQVAIEVEAAYHDRKEALGQQL